MSYKVELTRALFSDALGVPVATKNELLAEGKDLKTCVKLTPQVLIEQSRIKSVKHFIKERSCHDTKQQLFIKLICGNLKVVCFGDCTTIIDIKRVLEEDPGIPSDEQQLVCCGKYLEDDFVIPQDYNRATLHLYSRLPGGILTPNFFIDEDLFDHRFDYNYPYSDERQYYRGGERYKRPNGWSKIGLNIAGKYESDDWIGVHKSGKRFESAHGEWPVAYHGTTKQNAIDIAKYGFDETKRDRYIYDLKGDYSAPDINVASFFSRKFTYGDKRYKFVLQCRINPHTMIKTQHQLGEYYVTENTSDLRPYGICFKECDPQTKSKSLWVKIIFIFLVLLALYINEISESRIVLLIPVVFVIAWCSYKYRERQLARSLTHTEL